MKVLITSIGTRGDIEPLLAIGEILKEKGHEIICLFPEQFRELADDSGWKFTSLGSEFINMLDSPAGRTAMGGGKMGLKKLKAYITLFSMQKEINKAMVLKQRDVIEEEQPDRIVHNGKVIYPIIWAIENKGKRILISPVPYMHYVKDQAHVAFNRNFGALINKLTYDLASFGLVKTIAVSLKWLSNPKKIRTKEINKELKEGKAIYTISPLLFKKPEYWNENLQVLGYHERKRTINWEPSVELKTFLKNHPKVILVTFGSMVNTNPSEKTKIILEILEKNNIPAIINTASGGLVEPNSYNKDIFHFVTRIPYEWIFPRIYAVIHHGGSGTTHTAIKYGCASLIIPHIIDQYVWNRIIFKKELGPLGVDVSQISVNNLEQKIMDLYINESYKKKAEEIGLSMQNESYRMEICKTIEN